MCIQNCHMKKSWALWEVGNYIWDPPKYNVHLFKRGQAICLLFLWYKVIEIAHLLETKKYALLDTSIIYCAFLLDQTTSRTMTCNSSSCMSYATCSVGYWILSVVWVSVLPGLCSPSSFYSHYVPTKITQRSILIINWLAH